MHLVMRPEWVGQTANLKFPEFSYSFLPSSRESFLFRRPVEKIALERGT